MKHLIAPSLLSANFLDLRKEMEMINKSDADWLHLDIMGWGIRAEYLVWFPGT